MRSLFVYTQPEAGKKAAKLFEMLRLPWLMTVCKFGFTASGTYSLNFKGSKTVNSKKM
jgi:hypothetical protein